MKVIEQVLLAKNQTFPEKLKSLDLSLIAQKLMYPDYGQGWTASQVEKAIAHYKMFLHLLFLYPNSAIVPTQEIDQVWHQHILDTRKYAQDCEWLFGYFVHHYPYFGMGNDAEKQALETAFSDTQTLFAEHFGIDLIKVSYGCQDDYPIFSTGQANQPSACIELKLCNSRN